MLTSQQSTSWQSSQRKLERSWTALVAIVARRSDRPASSSSDAEEFHRAVAQSSMGFDASLVEVKRDVKNLG
jgi:hypothetical protein